MPLQDHHQIISVDDHLIEPPRVWQDRLPAKYQGSCPHIVEVDGNHLWSYEGEVFPTLGLNAVAGKPREEWGLDPLRYEDMIAGCYDPAARVADMDLDGVQAAICFPSFPGFAGGAFFRGKDKELANLCVQAWNDFYIDEWCATAPERFIPMAILPVWDIELTTRRSTPAIGILCGRYALTPTCPSRCISDQVRTCPGFPFKPPVCRRACSSRRCRSSWG